MGTVCWCVFKTVSNVLLCLLPLELLFPSVEFSKEAGKKQPSGSSFTSASPFPHPFPHCVALCPAELFPYNLSLLQSRDPSGCFPPWSQGLFPSDACYFPILELWAVNSQLLESAITEEKSKYKQSLEEEQKKIQDLESHLRSMAEVSGLHGR